MRVGNSIPIHVTNPRSIISVSDHRNMTFSTSVIPVISAFAIPAVPAILVIPESSILASASSLIKLISGIQFRRRSLLIQLLSLSRNSLNFQCFSRPLSES